MSHTAVLSDGKKACSEPRLEDVCVFLSAARRAGLSPDTAYARDIWEETEGVGDMGFQPGKAYVPDALGMRTLRRLVSVGLTVKEKVHVAEFLYGIQNP